MATVTITVQLSRGSEVWSETKTLPYNDIKLINSNFLSSVTLSDQAVAFLSVGSNTTAETYKPEKSKYEDRGGYSSTKQQGYTQAYKTEEKGEHSSIKQHGYTQQPYPVRKVNVVLEPYKGLSETFGNLLSLSDEDTSSSLVVNVIFEMERERNDTQDMKERIEKYPNYQNLVFVFCWSPRKNASNPNVCPNEQQLQSLASQYHFRLVLVKYKSELKNNEMKSFIPEDEKQKVASAVKEVKDRLKA